MVKQESLGGGRGFSDHKENLWKTADLLPLFLNSKHSHKHYQQDLYVHVSTM